MRALHRPSAARGLEVGAVHSSVLNETRWTSFRHRRAMSVPVPFLRVSWAVKRCRGGEHCHAPGSQALRTNDRVSVSATHEMQRIGNKEDLGKVLSPTLHLTKTTPPALILFGTSDRLLSHGEEFMKRSKELGHRAELFSAEGQPHGFFNRSPWQERTTYRVDEFLASLGYLEGKPTLKKP